jgi:DNA primase
VSSQIDQVKQATDIVQIIGARLALHRSGSSLRGLCPFHSEKSPSFFVNEQFQRYKCFGCGESGDVFTFLEKYDGMTFAESLKSLAEAAGITLTSFTATPQESARERSLTVLTQAQQYYHYLLTTHKIGESAREYLKERGITHESIQAFSLGYAPPAWDGLLTYLHNKKKVPLEDIQAAGLLVQGRANRAYDRFRHRIMFPLTNHRGQVVGFSGRLLSGDAKEAKYINTPETETYHKSKMLFGFSELYQEIRKAKSVVVVEGEFDVISSTQAHVNNVVAIKGSALTVDHAKLLKRAAERIILSLDTDSAGREASKRAIAVVKELDLEVRVAVLPQGKDPDELARHDPAAWREAVKHTVSVYDFLLQAALKTSDPTTTEGKRTVMKEFGPVLQQIPLAVEQDFYIKKLAEALFVSADVIRQDLARLSKVAVGTPPAKSEQKPGVATPPSHLERIERYLWSLALHALEQSEEAKTTTEWIDRLQAVPWQVSLHQRLAEALIVAKGTFTQRLQSLPADLHSLLFELYQDPQGESQQADASSEWRQSLTAHTHAMLLDRQQTLKAELEVLDAKAELNKKEQERQDELLAELAKVHGKLGRVV